MTPLLTNFQADGSLNVGNYEFQIVFKMLNYPIDGARLLFEPVVSISSISVCLF